MTGLETTVPDPEGLWLCACNYWNIGPLCTHCGESPPAREATDG